MHQVNFPALSQQFLHHVNFPALSQKNAFNQLVKLKRNTEEKRLALNLERSTAEYICYLLTGIFFYIYIYIYYALRHFSYQNFDNS